MSIIIKSSVCTCWACPTQYEGTLSDGNSFYFHYRYGCWSFSIAATSGEAIARLWRAGVVGFSRSGEWGDSMGGIMPDELVEAIINRCMREYNEVMGYAR